MDWFDIQVTRDELQKVDSAKHRTDLLQGLKNLKDQLQPKYFYWYFDISNEFYKWKNIIALVLRIGFEKKTKDMQKKIQEHFKKSGFQDSQILVRPWNQTELEGKYGKEGLQVYHDFMNATCSFVHLRTEEKYENMTEQNFIHFFISSLGYYFPQEALFHLDLFARRMALMFPYPKYEEYHKHVLRVVEDHLNKYFRTSAKR